MRIYRDYSLLGLPAMNTFSLVPEKSALVVVDMQYASIHGDYGFQKLYRQLGMESETTYSQERLWNLIVPNIQRLLDAFRRKEIQVIYLTVGSEREDYSDFCSRRLARINFWKERGIEIPYARVGDPGHAILKELEPVPGELVVNKTTASAFNSSTFSKVLKERGLSNLVFCGVGTNYCVEMTFRDASDRGYLCVLVEDACGTSTPEMHQRAVDTMSFYGRVESTESILKELDTLA